MSNWDSNWWDTRLKKFTWFARAGATVYTLTMLYKRFTITFDSGKTVPAIQIPLASEPDGLDDLLGLPACQGTVAVVGGAVGFDAPEYEPQRQAAFRILQGVAALAVRKKLVLVDGGTPYGVMRLLGRACSELEVDPPPLVGVAPLGQVRWPGCSPGLCGETELDAFHSAFVLVETDQWGAEAEMLAAVAHKLAPGRPTVELLINGGGVTRQDAAAFLRRGGNLVVLEGSGRFADELAAVVRAGHGSDPGLAALLSSGRIHVKPLNNPTARFVTWLENLAGW
jgi:hypothetical protein